MDKAKTENATIIRFSADPETVIVVASGSPTGCSFKTKKLSGITSVTIILEREESSGNNKIGEEKT